MSHFVNHILSMQNNFPPPGGVAAVRHVDTVHDSLGENCAHLQCNVVISLIKHLLGKPQVAVHPWYEEGG